MRIPEKLKLLNKEVNGRRWLEQLPQLVRELEEIWELSVDDPFDDSSVSYVAPALKHGKPVVVKIQWPHEECLHEVDALRVWNGNGAVRLLAADRTRHALLLERVTPGTHLSHADDIEPMDVMLNLLPRLWKPVSTPFTSLTTESQGWRDALYSRWEADGKRCEKSLIDTAYGLIPELSASQGEQVLVHQDLHGDNVISSDQRGWLAIDPKPLVGEREFSLSPIVRSFEFGTTRSALLYRLDKLTNELSLDRERARLWAMTHSVAWSFGGSYSQQHYQIARWLHAA